MSDQSKVDFSTFVHPQMLFSERALAANGEVFMNQNDLKTSRDFVVDYIWFSEYSLPDIGGVPGAQATLIQDMWVNWAITDRAWWFPQDVVPAPYMQTHWDADRTQAANLALNLANPTFVWRHPLRWLYNPNQGVTVEWEDPGTIANSPGFPTPGGGLPGLGFGFNGFGLKTGRRRLFNMEWAIAAQGVGPAPVIATASVPATMHNLGDEPYLIETTHLPMFNTNLLDQRWLNYYRMKVQPTWGNAWSELRVPFLMYGTSIGPNNRDCWYKPSGGPIYMKAGQSVNFRVQNRSLFPTTVQVGLIGRVAFGLGSVY